MIRKILEVPHPLLAQKCEPVDLTCDSHCEVPIVITRQGGVHRLDCLIHDLFETLYASKIGIALAAPQIGVSARLFVLDVGLFHPAPYIPGRMVIVNPTLILGEEKRIDDESCLSIPGLTVRIERAFRVNVEAFDEFARPLNLTAAGLLARCIQHETDHLDGILITDRAQPLKQGALELGG